jgi:hypothetical protein
MNIEQTAAAIENRLFEITDDGEAVGLVLTNATEIEVKRAKKSFTDFLEETPEEDEDERGYNSETFARFLISKGYEAEPVYANEIRL